MSGSVEVLFLMFNWKQPTAAIRGQALNLANKQHILLK